MTKLIVAIAIVSGLTVAAPAVAAGGRGGAGASGSHGHHIRHEHRRDRGTGNDRCSGSIYEPVPGPYPYRC